jgi:hypothetical protein
MNAVTLLLSRARIDAEDLDMKQRAELYELASKILPEGSNEAIAAAHTAFLLRESLRSQMAFSSLLLISSKQ